MKVYVGMTCQPPVPLWLMRIEIVQDNVDFSAGVSGQNIVHEIQKLAPAAPR